ncbi:hypothetical protein [Gryllotalpicola protaetiae]|uniref:Uncharacterized protein n=1 Tax=Gryllotalpicola protaetiae TaxID=2419771 RepID=A0A387BE10_9MICO|nr:hypothetical protein [Gryllotalpicola protaetiae]AYG02195.1 hypothetical protein D7I44_00705 [Gryllotalpicola protaetiae]
MDPLPELADVQDLLTGVLVLDVARLSDSAVAQIAALRGVSGSVTMLDLDIPTDAPNLALSSPARRSFAEAVVVGDSGEEIGGIILWASNERLSALEFYWYTDERPARLPRANQLVAAVAH